jgi:hypothetical protein
VEKEVMAMLKIVAPPQMADDEEFVSALQNFQDKFDAIELDLRGTIPNDHYDDDEEVAKAELIVEEVCAALHKSDKSPVDPQHLKKRLEAAIRLLGFETPIYDQE